MSDPTEITDPTPSPDELSKLIESVLGGTLDAEGLARLETRLRDDPAAQLEYLRQTTLEHAIRSEIASRLTYQAVAELRESGQVSPSGQVIVRPAVTTRRMSWRGGYLRLAALAAMLLVGLAVVFARSGTTPPLAVAPPVESSEPSPEVAPTPETEEIAEPEGGPFLVVDSRAAVWATVNEIDFHYRLAAGVVHLSLGPELTVAVEGPAEFELDPDGDELQLIDGIAALSVPASLDRFRAFAGDLRIDTTGVEYGLSVDRDSGVVRLVAFRGELKADFLRSGGGNRQSVRLTQDEGLDLRPGGLLTTSIIGGHERFAAVRHSVDLTVPLLANASFEYPRTTNGASRVPAAWTLLSHPLNNADQMAINGGILPGHHERVAPQRWPEPVGKQWVFLQARTYDDGRSTFASLHQSAGLFVPGAEYRLKAMVGRPDDGPVLGYSLGLYVGHEDEGPTAPLQVWSSPGDPPSGGSMPIDLRFRAPPDPRPPGEQLFVMVTASPPSEPGQGLVLFDAIRLDRLDTKPAR